MESDELNIFANTLKDHVAKKTCTVYDDNTEGQNKLHNVCDNKNISKIQDVISNISKQVKAIQSADHPKKKLTKMGNLNIYKTSDFLPVHMVHTLQHTEIHNFETQFELDSQLINLIEGAEAMTDIPKNSNQIVIEAKLHNIDNTKTIIPENIYNANNKIEECLQVQDILQSVGVKENIHITEYKKDLKSISQNEVGIKTTIKATSPNLNKNISEPKSPLVYRLETFEKFENLAVPLINDSLDFETAKKLIHSQILNKELFIQTHTEPVLGDRDKTPSPILGKSIGIKKKDTKKSITNTIEDEILFSDEDFEDLPLTCALETSFYRQNNVLDKTMFVGFQTASDKSIQVHKESYAKAKSILDDNVSITKLVEFIDSSNMLKDSKESDEDNIFIGFKTAQGNKITVPKESIIKTKKNFQDILDGETVNPKYNNLNDRKVKLLENDITIVDKGETNKESIRKTLIGNRLFNKEVCTISFGNIENANIDENVMKEFENNFLDDDDGVVTRNGNNNKPKNNDLVLNEYNNNMMPSSLAIPSKKSINVSTKDFSTSKKAFDDIDYTDLHEVIVENKENFVKNDNQLSTSTFLGFITANNRAIQISEKAYAKTKNIFDNIDQVTLPHKENVTDILISASEKPLNKENNIGTVNTYKDTLDTLDNKFKIPNITKISSKISGSSCSDLKRPFGGFKTASNKTVKISQAALVISENIFKEILNEKGESKHLTPDGKECSDKKNAVIKEINMKKNIQHIGFKTASNKVVQVSESNLEKSRKLFEEIILNEENDHIFNKNKEQSILPTIKTASNNPVKISDEALAKSRKILYDVQDAKKYEKKDEKSTSYTEDLLEDNMPNRFKTTNNKPIKINKETMIKSKYIFQDIEETSVLQSLKVNTTIFKGFKTASNKAVNISEEAIARTKNLFQDIEIEISNKNINGEKKFAGFHTASNKEVKISEEALMKSKRIFDSLNEYKADSHANKSKAKDVFTFQTASNKKVCVSEESLEKSKIFTSNRKTLIKDPTMALKKEENRCEEHDDVNMDDLINTEVIKDLEETLHAEEFKNKTTISKRSGSPILSCPNAKKSKFKTPKIMKADKKDILKTDIVETTNNVKFCENYKKSKSITLKDLNIDLDMENIDLTNCAYNFNTLLNFEFRGKRNDVDNDVWTTDKIKQYFTDAVNRKIIPDGWLDNHLKLIIWKLLSYEVIFSKCMKDICSVNNVLNQLKYRYDRELYNVERPVLRKILEKDEVASKMMILCVVGFYIDGVYVNNSIGNKAQNIEILLTDGWYCIKACADRMFDQLISEGKILVGTKLAVHGAELMNCEQGIAPWEDTSQVRLKIFANSARRARWHARLGYHGNAAILSPLSSIRVDGGKVSRIRAYVARVYPMLYVEKFDDGSTVTRSERLEHIHQGKYETDRQNQMEKLYDEVETMSEQESQDSERMDSDRNLDSGSQIYRAMKRSKDTTDFKINLSNTQVKLLQEHTNRKQEIVVEKLQKKLQEIVKKRGLDLTRNVVPLLKIRIADVNNDCVTKAMLTIWRPTDCLLELIKEGSWIDVYNVVPTAVRYGELQISAGRQSIFQKSKIKQNSSINITDKLKRQCYHIKDLQSIKDNEIDTAGLIFLIEQTKNQFQNVFITDENKNIVCINFWGGINKFGFENILNVGEIISCVNLQKRTGNTKGIPQYRVTEFSFFTKTSKIDVIRKHTDKLISKFAKVDQKKFINECIAIRNNINYLKHSNITPYRLNNSDFNISKNKIFIDSPLNKVDLNLSGLDFESTFKQRDTQDLSPNSKRKKIVNEKIARLKRYGEPPPISPIHIQNSEIKPYKSPLVEDVARLEKLPENNDVIARNSASIKILPEKKNNSSPLLNRTFTKFMNPVKLNFSTELDSTDPFDEEFNYSPPLSLE